MMIEFEPPKPIAQQSVALMTVAENMMRPVSCYFDDNEHEIPWDYINFMHMAMKASGAGSLAPEQKVKVDAEGKPRPRIGYQNLAHVLEMLSWGDTGMYLCTPGGSLGVAAVEAGGTPEQKEKFLARFKSDKPVFGAMAMTESQAGSDTAAIQTTAVLDQETNEWVLNGEKIFVTGRINTTAAVVPPEKPRGSHPLTRIFRKIKLKQWYRAEFGEQSDRYIIAV